VQPDPDLLRRYALGQLDAAEAAAVECWLAEHPDALDQVTDATLTPGRAGGDPPFVEAVGGGPRRLGGFRLGRLLGAGGMGQVYEAHDERLGRRVAVKVIHPAIAADPRAKARFLREAKAAAAVEHDHVVPILEVGEDAGRLYLAMPYLKGESLHDRLRRPGPLPPADVVKIGREAAAGLAAVHAAGLVHRDVKPANLWLEVLPDGAWRVKLLDFGLVRLDGPAGEALSAPGEIVGTPAFMAPEQARGGAVDGRADLFGLGCVLYLLAAGRLPFDGDSPLAVLAALAAETPTPVGEVNPAVRPRLGRLIDRLLAKRPEDRPASAVEVIAELRAIERDDRPPPRRRSWATLLRIAVVLALLGGAALAVYKLVTDAPSAHPGRPFVVGHEAFDTLEAALTAAGPGGVAIHADGPLAIGPVDRRPGEGLRLVAGPGYRPLLVPAPAVWERPDFDGFWFTVPDGPVELDGLDIDGRGGGALSLLDGAGGWEIRRCRLVHLDTVARHQAGPGVTVADSLIVAGPAFVLRGEAAELRLSNNLIDAGTLFTLRGNGQKVHLDHNTLIVHLTDALGRIGDEARGGSVTATGNVINLAKAFGPVPLRPGDRARASWAGRDNLYVGADVPEAGSRSLPFLGGRAEALRWTDPGWAAWRAEVEAARVRHALPDLGPDFDRIGPGRPYWDTFPADRAVKRPVPDGGPVVALADGKELAGFATLEAALAKAPMADSFEVRTDRPLDGVTVPAGRGAVTLRAGYGYAPHVGGIVVEAGCRLTVEGLTIPNDAYVHCRDGSRLVRLAHLGGGSVYARGGPDAATAARVTACFLERVSLSEGHLAVTDSALTALHVAPPGTGVTVAVDRCLVVNRTDATDAPFQGVTAAAGQPAWGVRRTLIDTNNPLLWSVRPDRWTGERNVYRTGRSLVAGEAVFDLATFRRWAGGAEAGCALDRPSTFDPALWELRADVRKGLGGKSYGADVSRVLAPVPR